MEKKQFTKLINTLVEKKVQAIIKDEYIPIFSQILAEEINAVKVMVTEALGSGRPPVDNTNIGSIIGESGLSEYKKAASQFTGESPRVLNGLPSNGAGAGIDTITSPEVGGTVTVPDALKGVLNKDYSQILEKMDEKKGGGPL